jgi:hypothetical protein
VLVFYGTYAFSRKVIACRNEYCNQCRRYVVGLRMRYFCCGHIYFIPFLPLGFREMWCCAQCHDNPRASYNQTITTMQGVASGISAIGALLAVGSLTFMRSPEMSWSDMLPVTLIGLGIMACCLAVGWWALRLKRREDTNRPPISKPESCPICQSKLSTDPYLACKTCNLRVYED